MKPGDRVRCTHNKYRDQEGTVLHLRAHDHKGGKVWMVDLDEAGEVAIHIIYMEVIVSPHPPALLEAVKDLEGDCPAWLTELGTYDADCAIAYRAQARRLMATLDETLAAYARYHERAASDRLSATGDLALKVGIDHS